MNRLLILALVAIEFVSVLDRVNAADGWRETIKNLNGANVTDGLITLQNLFTHKNDAAKKMLERGVLPRLVELLESDSEIYQLRSKYILIQASQTDHYSVFQSGISERLIKLLSSTNAITRQYALEILSEFAREDAEALDIMIKQGIIEALVDYANTEQDDTEILSDIKKVVDKMLNVEGPILDEKHVKSLTDLKNKLEPAKIKWGGSLSSVMSRMNSKINLAMDYRY